MKLGLGLYKHMLTAENFAFARQCGATHLVIHLVDYFKRGHNNPSDNQPTGNSHGWGMAGDPNKLWTLEELLDIKRKINDAGLVLEAIENFDPAHWHDVLLDGPKKEEQINNLKTIIHRVGQAGIPIMGYNFSIAGVCGRITGPFARGGAMSVGMEDGDDTPIPNGMVWNMVYDTKAQAGTLPEITTEQLWNRLAYFLNAILPTAQQAGVSMALHPDDPPLPTMRQQPRLVYQPHLYDKLININPSPNSKFELCLGTLAEMSEGDVYEALDQYTRQNRVAYVHVRNVHGKVPSYRETFIDDGDLDMLEIIRILKKNNFDGVLIPDHTPQMTCSAPWHAGMAHALGYLKGLISSI
jgi:mannonate dehydratase